MASSASSTYGCTGRSEHTQRAYRRDADRCLAFVDCSVKEVALGGVPAFADSLEGLMNRARGRCSRSATALPMPGYYVTWTGSLELPQDAEPPAVATCTDVDRAGGVEGRGTGGH